MMKTLLLLVLYTTVVIELCWTGKVSSSSCQVYPSEYAYRSDSVFRNERYSANCRRYLSGLDFGSIHPEDYTHCNGTQPRLTDSDFGSDQYSSSDYYVWTDGTRGSQLLFIFPTRVNLTNITLHYYSDSIRGLPRQRFYAVPDDFEIWDALTARDSHVDIAALPPGGEPGRRNISTEVNFITKKVLMYMFKYTSSFTFVVSEVEFFFCNSINTTMSYYFSNNTTYTRPVIVNTETKAGSRFSTSSQDELGTLTKSTVTVARESTTTSSLQRVNTCTCDTSVSISEVVAWVLVSILTVLFTGLLTVIVLWLYKKRQSRDIDERAPKYEMEGNPCYEATGVKHTTDVETHVYEAVKGGGAK